MPLTCRFVTTAFYRGWEALSNFVTSELAEGVVSALFLPSGDQGHNDGFAAAPKQHPITRGITDKIPSVIHEGGDRGVLVMVSAPGKPAGKAFVQIAETLRKKLA
jgi:hypothetical protein